MKSGDKVNIVNDKLEKLYNIKPTDVFTAKTVTPHVITFVEREVPGPVPVQYVHVVNDPIKDFNLKNEISDLVNEYIDEDKAFTAFDVTCDLRTAFEEKNIYHSDVRGTVHSIMENYPSYNKELVDVDGNQSFLYFPDDDYDISSYVPYNGAQILNKNSNTNKVVDALVDYDTTSNVIVTAFKKLVDKLKGKV